MEMLQRSSRLSTIVKCHRYFFKKDPVLNMRFACNCITIKENSVAAQLKGSYALRNYSSDKKYDIHNPFDSEEVVDQNAKKIVERKPASYWKSLFQIWKTPAPALLTGLAGLVPFAAAPSYLYFVATSFDPFVISAQLAYGAVILSFVGGIRWGFLIPYRHGSTHMVTWPSITRSVVPSLIAWGGILLPDLTAGLLTVSFGLMFSLYNDLRMFGDYPKWMMGLRCLLTTIAVATLLASVVLVEENRIQSTFGRKTKNKLLEKEI